MKPRDNRVCIIDASPSGVSGDKYLGALIDLGGKPETLRRVARVVAENLPGTKSVGVEFKKVERGEIGAQLVSVESNEADRVRKGSAILYSTRKCIGKLGLSDWGSKFAVSTVGTLLEAESRVHGHKSAEVELHELGSADTLVDVLGVACLAESLGLETAEWWSTRVPVGRGTTHFSNRDYPNPPPAVAEILRKHHFPMERGEADVELSTPSGVALTVNLVSKFTESFPPLWPERIAYGAGSKEIEEFANVLRLTVGRRMDDSHSHDKMVILETNVDDVSGEIIGYAVEKLMSAGARDVTVTPVLMKKNRPGHIISVIASRESAERLASLLLKETGTLGVREIPVSRHISNREFSRIELKIGNKSHSVRLKVAKDPKGKILRAKPEYDDLKRLADQTGVTLRSLARKAERIAEHYLSKSRS